MTETSGGRMSRGAPERSGVQFMPGLQGFSLVEVVIALGIVSFALLALYGLLPVGYKNAQDSRRETRAAFVAEQIIRDLRASPFTNATILMWNDSGKLIASTPLDLSVGGTRVLGCDSRNRLTKEYSAGTYSSGSTDADLELLTQVKIEKTAFANLARVAVEVTAPASAALAARQRYGFSSFVEKRQ